MPSALVQGDRFSPVHGIYILGTTGTFIPVVNTLKRKIRIAVATAALH